MTKKKKNAPKSSYASRNVLKKKRQGYALRPYVQKDWKVEVHHVIK